ncbi:REJ domain-containing protein [Pelagophyceae sp. CCMP2097]|nr:REJ domain-containing protein [Pelagophyceae sp. CCMP2097]
MSVPTILPTAAPLRAPTALDPTAAPSGPSSAAAGVEMRWPSVLIEGEKDTAVLVLSGVRFDALTLTANCAGGVVFDPRALTVQPGDGDVVEWPLAAINDFVDGGAASRGVACVVTVASVDTRYDDIGFSVAVLEDDVAGVFLVDAALEAFYHVADGIDVALRESEYGGASGMFAVRLQSRPRSAVTVTAATSSSRVNVFPQVHTVAPEAWRELLWFTIDVADDSDTDGNDVYIVDLKTTSADALYDGAMRRVSFTVTEDDVAGVFLSATMVLDVGADGAGATFPDSYDVSLTSRPLADVRVALEIVNAVDPAAARVSPQSLFFAAGAGWADVQTVTVASSAANAVFSVRHAVASEDTAYDSFALKDVRVAVVVTTDSSPPPKLYRARFLDNGAGLLVQFQAPTDGAGLAPSQNGFACDVLFTNVSAFGCKATASDGDCRCAWASAARVDVTVSFGPGAYLVPYMYGVAESPPSRSLRQSPSDGGARSLRQSPSDGASAVAIKGGVVKASSKSTLYAPAQTTVALRPLSPVKPAVAISAPSSVSLCDAVLLDAASATGDGSRKLRYTWGCVVEAADVAVDTAKIVALVAAANAKGDVAALALPSDALTPTATYFATVTATNYLDQATTASHRFFKSPVPAPAIHFEKAAIRMYRTEAKTILTVVALPDLRCTSLNVKALSLVYTWRVDSSDPRAGLSAAEIATFTAYPTTMRLPANTLTASNSYLVACTVAFAHDLSINTTVFTRITVLSGALVAKIKGGMERSVAVGNRLTLDGADSTDPDASTAALVYAWACTSASTAATAGVSFYEVGAATATTSTNFAKVEAVFDSRHGDARLACTLVVSKPGRTAVAASSVVVVSADVAAPVVRVTSTISAKYNPSAYAAIAFDFASPDSTRTVATRWSSLDAPSGLFSKAVTASSPMLIDLGFAEPRAVYNLRLTATDSRGSSSYAVIELTMNAPPTSGVFTVSPISGAPLVTVFRLEMAEWSDDEDDLPFTYGFSREVPLNARRVSLVADLYLSSYIQTLLPMPAGSNSITVHGRVYDRFGAYAAASAEVGLRGVPPSLADLTALSESLVADALATSSGSDALNVLAVVASLVTASLRNATKTDATNDAAFASLVESLMDAVSAATALVVTAASAVARGQALGAIDELTAASAALTTRAQYVALRVLASVVDTAPSLDDDAAAAAVNAASHLLDATLFAAANGGAPERRRLDARAFGRRRRRLLAAPSAAPTAAPSSAPTALLTALQPSTAPILNQTGGFDVFAANQLVDIIAATAAAMIAESFGGQFKMVAANNLELGVWRMDCGTRADGGYALGQGGRVRVPASVLDAVAGGSCADADVDVRVARIKNVYPLDGIASALLQVELGAHAETVAVDAAAEPLLITIDTLEYEATFARDFDLSAPALQRNGTCFNASQVLAFDDCPYGAAVHSCGDALTATLPDGSNVTLYVTGTAPLAVLVTCPVRAPRCRFWDRGLNEWSDSGCSVFEATPWNVTCACTHLTDFAAQARSTASTARAVVQTLGSLSIADLLEAMLIFVTLVSIFGVMLLACCHGRKLDAMDRAKRHDALQAERLEQFQADGLYDDAGRIDVNDFMGPAEQQILVARWRAEKARGWLDRDQGDAFKAYSRAVLPSSKTHVGDFIWSVKREHRVAQVIYLADGTFTRQERIFVICVVVFTNLFVEAFLVQFQPVDTAADALSWNVVRQKLRYTALSSVCATLLHLPVAAAFRHARDVDGAPRTSSRVDHLLGNDGDGAADDVAKSELALRLRVLGALTKVQEAEAAQKLAAKALLAEYVRLWAGRRASIGGGTAKGGTAKAPTVAARERFAVIHRSTSAKYESDVAAAERVARDAELLLAAAVRKHADRKHALSLDEQALLEAEAAETRALPFWARKVWARYISPLRKSLGLGRAPRPLPWAAGPLVYLCCAALCGGSAAYVFGFAVAVSHCAACEPPQPGTEVCLARGGGRCAVSSCAGTLVSYCGHGAHKTSLAWLEMVVASTIFSLVLSEALEIYSRSCLKSALKRCLGAEALAASIQSTALKIRTAQRAAAAKRAVSPQPAGEEKHEASHDDVDVRAAEQGISDGETTDGDARRPVAWPQPPGHLPPLDVAKQASDEVRAASDRRELPRKAQRAAAAAQSRAKKDEGPAFEDEIEFSSITVPDSLRDLASPDSLRDLDVFLALVDRPEAWRCPCGLTCARKRRGAHLRECAAFRDAWHAAVVGYLAVEGPEASARAVSSVAAMAQCSADVALCALAESRGLEPLALEKLQHAGYRAELGIIAAGVAAMSRPPQTADELRRGNAGETHDGRRA